MFLTHTTDCLLNHSSNHPPTPPPSFIKGVGVAGIDFLKFGNKSGDEKFFLEREGLD